MVSDQYDPYENIKKQSLGENNGGGLTEKNGVGKEEDMAHNLDNELDQGKKKKAKKEKKKKNKENEGSSETDTD